MSSQLAIHDTRVYVPFFFAAYGYKKTFVIILMIIFVTFWEAAEPLREAAEPWRAGA